MVPLPVKPSLDHEPNARCACSCVIWRDAIRCAKPSSTAAAPVRTHSPDSDADIAIILDGERGDRSAAVKDMAGIAFHVMMETGVMVEAMPLWADELARPETFSIPTSATLFCARAFACDDGAFANNLHAEGGKRLGLCTVAVGGGSY